MKTAVRLSPAPIAEEGDAEAQFDIGRMYAKVGRPSGLCDCAGLVSKAADQGHAGAQCRLGVMYEEGWGVAQDYATALGWYRKAADQGDADAQFYLAGMFDNGKGVAQDYATAAGWLRIAAEQGHAGAQFNLGVLYEQAWWRAAGRV